MYNNTMNKKWKVAMQVMKKPRDFDALLDKIADNDHIELDNIDIKVYFSL